ncbi:MAG: ATP-dependent DNA helicase [Clostridia bacterium]
MENIYFADITEMLNELGILKEPEKIVGFINSAILIEKQTTKGYSYSIVDPKDFKTYHLTSRKNPIQKKNFYILKEKVDKLGDFSQILPIMLESNDKRAELLLEKIFKDVLPRKNLRYREQQLDLSKTMLKALQKNLLALCEAEVGTGKTHAYILAVAVNNLFDNNSKSTIISTSTIALQKALTEDYIPSISKILKQEKLKNTDLKYVLRKGKSHYICEKKLNGYLNSIVFYDNDKIVNYLYKIKNEKNIIDLDNLDISKYVKQRICVDVCSENCGYKCQCRYKMFLQRCKINNYDFQIVNHNYLIAHLLAKKHTNTALLSDFESIIIDEAHKFPEVMRDMYGIKLYETDIPDIVKQIQKVTYKFRDVLQKIQKENSTIFQIISNKYPNNGIVELDIETKNKISFIISSLLALKNKNELSFNIKKPEVRKVRFSIDKIISKLQIFSHPKEYIIWKQGKTQLRAISKNVSKQMNTDLWSIDMPIIMTSGTISVRGDFSYLEHISGLDMTNRKILKMSTTSPFDYKKQALLYLPDKLRFSENDSNVYFQSIVEEIERLIQATFGHTMILFTSYTQMERTFLEISKRNLIFPLFCMKKGDMTVINDFKNSGNGVLFASDSAGEGIDIAGDVLSSLIIVKLPFPIPNATSVYELEQKQDFEQFLNKDIIPNMIIKLRQWIGRGVRRENDTCVFSILDFRADKRYYNEIINALPPISVTSELDDVRQFILNKKDEDYFLA